MLIDDEQSFVGFELRFQSLGQAGRVLAFPCDATGRVDLNAVSDRTKNNYLFARAMVGRDYAVPVVQQFTDQTETSSGYRHCSLS